MEKISKNMKENEKGFTLIELIVVIAIIGILAAVLLPKFSGFTDKARKSAVMAEAKSVYTAYLTCQAENGEVKSIDIINYLGKAPKAQNGTDALDDLGVVPGTITPTGTAIAYDTNVNGKVYKVAITGGGDIIITP